MPQVIVDSFNFLVVQPVTNILVSFYVLYAKIGLSGAFGLAIISITVLFRGLMHPFFRQQMETAKKMKEIKPRLDALAKKHKKDPQTLQKEQMNTYKEAGINPASGCLFALIQMPLIFGLYQTLQSFLVADPSGKIIQQINEKLYHPMIRIQSIDPNFFMFNLAVSPAQVGATAPYYYLVPVITAVLQYFQTVLTMPHMTGDDAKKEPENALEVSEKKKKKDVKKEEPSTSDDFQKAMGTQMKYIFPLMIGYFSYTLPFGLSLYWNAFSLFSIIQHYIDQKNAQKKELVKA